MSDHDVNIVVPGKWILAGEHAVVRGFPAVALPHPEYHLQLRYHPDPSAVCLNVKPAVLEPMLAQLISQLAQACGVKNNRARGSLFLDSTIPLQAGFGSSAALCTAITRWFVDLHGLEQSKTPALASELENYFHGKSSGLDIAVVSCNAPILFRRGDEPQILEVPRQPRFSFHDTGVRASTRECISRVEALFESHPKDAAAYDAAMGASAESAAKALQEFATEPELAVGKLADAINRAQDCFRAWGLLPPEAEALERDLRDRGALAVKVTGAGAGGFLVALWPQESSLSTEP